MKKIAVLIPCYNEEQTISTVVKDFRKELPTADIYVYDNNSSDDTVKIAEKAGAIVRHEYKQGKGNVIRRMFREVEADIYIMIDGDDTYPAHHVHEMIKYVDAGKAEMVIGDRLSSTYFTENKRMFHNMGNVVVRFLVNLIFNGDIRDIMTGYRVFSRSFVKTFPVMSSGFQIETEMSIHALDKRMHVVPVMIEYRDRPDGSVSKLNTVKDGINVIEMIFNLFKEYKPLMFFTLVSLFSLLVAVLFFMPAFIGYINTGLVLKFPSLIAASFFGIISIVMFVTGLILDSNVNQARKDFEIRLIAIENKEKNNS